VQQSFEGQRQVLGLHAVDPGVPLQIEPQRFGVRLGGSLLDAFFQTLGPDAAVEKNVVDLIAPDIDSLLEQVHGREIEFAVRNDNYSPPKTIEATKELKAEKDAEIASLKRDVALLKSALPAENAADKAGWPLYGIMLLGAFLLGGFVRRRDN